MHLAQLAVAECAGTLTVQLCDQTAEAPGLTLRTLDLLNHRSTVA